MKITPTEVDFTKTERVSLKVTASDDMVWKVLTTLPTGLTSNPSIGVLAGGRSADVTITFRKEGYETRDKGQELKLKLQTRNITKDEYAAYSANPRQSEFAKTLLTSGELPTTSMRIPIIIKKPARFSSLSYPVAFIFVILFYFVGVVTASLWEPLMFSALKFKSSPAVAM